MNDAEIPAVCEVHDGCGHLVVRCEGHRIVLDGHADRCCVFTLDAGAVDRLFDALGKWLSDRASWVLAPDGLGHLPGMQGRGLMVTACQRSLSDWVPCCGPVPKGQRWCPQCYAAFGLLPHLAVPLAQAPAGRRLSDAPESTPDDQPVPAPSAPGARAPGWTEPNLDSCPYCDVVGSVRRVACEYPKVDAWSCAACGGEWWTSVVNPVNAFSPRLAENVAARSLLRKAQVLAEQAPGLSDGQVKARALSLLAELDQHARIWPG